MRILLLLSPLFCNLLLLLSVSSDKSRDICISPGGRFPPFSSEGKPPKKATKGPRDLTVCRVFRKKTCCDAAQTHPALLSIRKLASSGEANPDCLQLWELLECSICDPRVGVRPGPPVICTSLCDRTLNACSNAYFSVDTMTKILSPCGSNDIVCGRATELVSNGTEFCLLAGFSTQSSNGNFLVNEESFCYGEKLNLDSIIDSWKTPSDGRGKFYESGLLDKFLRSMKEMSFGERVSWAVGGLVLTAGLVFHSKRKSHSFRQKQAAIVRTARMLEAKFNKPPSAGQRKKGVGR